MRKYFEYQGQKLAYLDEGKGPVVLFVHGTPSSSAEFEAVAEKIKGNYRCLALDHLGFGQSDKPKEGEYTLEKHIERLSAFLKFLNLKQFHLIVHDFGGVIGLSAAVRNWDQVQSLTVMNTWAWPLRETEPTLDKQKKMMTSGLMKWLYKNLNFSARVMVKAAWGKHSPLTSEKHKAYQSAFKSASERMGTVGCLEALFDSENPTWSIHKKLEGLPTKPMLVLWGAQDKLVSTKTLDRWKATFPQAQVKVLDQVGHFVCDEAPDLVAPALQAHLSQAQGK